MADPTSITGLQDWWTSGGAGAPTRVYSDAGTTLVNADGQLVQQWTGVNGAIAIQNTSGNRPKWDNVNGAINNDYGLTNGFFNISGVAQDRQNFTEFFVVELLTMRNANDPIAGGQAHHFMSVHMGGNIYYDRGAYMSIYDGTSIFQDTTHGYNLQSSRALIVVRGDGVGATVVVNGVTYGIGAGALAAGNWTLTEILEDVGVGWSLNAKIYDYGYYNSALSGGDLSALLTWAQTSRGVPVPANFTQNSYFDGDSLTVGAYATLNRNYPYYVNKTANIPLLNRWTNGGEGGLPLVTMVSEGATLVDPWILAGKTNVNIAWGGTNDLAINSNSVATVRSNTKTYTNARKVAGWNKSIFLGMLPRPAAGTFSDANLTTINGNYRSDFDAGAATWNVDAFVDLNADPVIGGLDGGGTGNNYNATYYSADNIHLIDAGIKVVSNLVYPFWAPMAGVTASSYLVSGGASSGNINVASPAFTVTLAGGSYFNTTQSISLRKSGAAGGTFNITSGGVITGNGTSVATVTPLQGDTSFTFTFTPTVAGSYNIFGTNNQRGWTDIANIPFTGNNPAPVESNNPPSLFYASFLFAEFIGDDND